jgi:DNA-binding FadR family transcriptional regulator
MGHAEAATSQDLVDRISRWIEAAIASGTAEPGTQTPNAAA